MVKAKTAAIIGAAVAGAVGLGAAAYYIYKSLTQIPANIAKDIATVPQLVGNSVAQGVTGLTNEAYNQGQQAKQNIDNIFNNLQIGKTGLAAEQLANLAQNQALQALSGPVGQLELGAQGAYELSKVAGSAYNTVANAVGGLEQGLLNAFGGGPKISAPAAPELRTPVQSAPTESKVIPPPGPAYTQAPPWAVYFPKARVFAI